MGFQPLSTLPTEVTGISRKGVDYPLQEGYLRCATVQSEVI